MYVHNVDLQQLWLNVYTDEKYTSMYHIPLKIIKFFGKGGEPVWLVPSVSDGDLLQIMRAKEYFVPAGIHTWDDYRVVTETLFNAVNKGARNTEESWEFGIVLHCPILVFYVEEVENENGMTHYKEGYEHRTLYLLHNRFF